MNWTPLVIVGTLAQIPTPATGDIERWLISGAAVLSIVLLVKNLFIRKPPIEAEFVNKSQCLLMHERIDKQFDALSAKLDEFRNDFMTVSERRGRAIHERINAIEATVARIDERTHK